MATYYSSINAKSLSSIQKRIDDLKDAKAIMSEKEQAEEVAGIYFALHGFIPGPAGLAAGVASLAIAISAYYNNPAELIQDCINDLEDIEDVLQDTSYSQVKIQTKFRTQYVLGEKYSVPSSTYAVAYRREGSSGWDLV